MRQTEVKFLTPAEAAEKAQRMRGIIAASVSELDLAQIMASMVGRAKNGDGKMMDRVISLIGVGAAPAPSVGNMVQVNVGENRDVQIIEGNLTAGELHRVATMLSEHGPSARDVIETQCNLPPGGVGNLIAAGILKETKKGVSLTPAGRKKAASLAA